MYFWCLDTLLRLSASCGQRGHERVHNRRTTRASSHGILSGSIEDVIRNAKIMALHEKRALREQKYDSESIPQFHLFMRLPLGLRACV